LLDEGGLSSTQIPLSIKEANKEMKFIAAEAEKPSAKWLCNHRQ
jgi:hypothetical protein